MWNVSNRAKLPKRLAAFHTQVLFSTIYQVAPASIRESTKQTVFFSAVQ
jgi:hypothetical protein